MAEPAYYKLSDVEALFGISRDTLTRWAAAGIFEIHGSGWGRRVTGVSVRAALARVERGEDLWATARSARAPQPTAEAVSTKTVKAAGGSSRRRSTAADSDESAPLAAKPPSWLKRIT